MDTREAWQVLDVGPDSTQSDIKQAYRDLARIWHPDRFQSDDRLRTKAEENSKSLTRLTIHFKIINQTRLTRHRRRHHHGS